MKHLERISLYSVGDEKPEGDGRAQEHTLAAMTVEDFYQHGLGLASSLLRHTAENLPPGLDADLHTTTFVKEILRRAEGEEAWKLLCICRADSEPNPLPAHMVNCAILAAWLGPRAEIGITKESALPFAKVAFLHDLGMMRAGTAWTEPRALTESERLRMEEHPAETRRILESLGSCVNHHEMLDTAEDHHERADGSGYPRRKSEKDIAPAAALLGIIDIFDAATHRRPHRTPMMPFNAMSVISHATGTAFPRSVGRRFLSLMSMYPIGSGVRLNSRFVARVIGANVLKPTRPIVRIVPSPGMDTHRENTVIDLTEESMMFIREPVNLDPLDPVFKVE